MVRHTHQDALSDSECERLLAATEELDEPYQSEAMFILIAGGRLGMRGGEIAHFDADWIDWQRDVIDIPRFDACDCGYCWKQSQQSAAHHDDLTVDEAFAEYWQPKTEHAARAVPFDFDDRVEAVITAFAEEHGEYPHSRVSVNRRVTRVANAAGLDPGKVYPHCLRATAATYHAYRGLTAVPLMSLMGWADIQTARKYIQLSGGATADALREIHEN